MDDEIIIWEPKPLEKPEFRLYYNDEGRVVCYTCEKLEGKYVVIDALTYAQGRHDIRVIDGKISKASNSGIVSKLMPNDTGISCASEDINILVSEGYDGNITKWKLNLYEL